MDKFIGELGEKITVNDGEYFVIHYYNFEKGENDYFYLPSYLINEDKYKYNEECKIGSFMNFAFWPYEKTNRQNAEDMKIINNIIEHWNEEDDF